ncbi:hypothetical protein M430DRAFT_139760 [Amorphotheca resinae ATCC 22711]|uniref:Alpha/beta hydrolase fold-3 domain-containing protein n=1 Tax=Amorphotheca resinae ATCC 22711 TaxID=857342 RepID=A0A2T3B1R3_AMORE|nr:hypothetical protein M430DRAFT_139760 [Amorphotheca resinae ATCC 22711]PSS18483.1 hypothetical protein M430DRAFT_139760 [Amorphotheca resinae ATCC 22711]
MATTPYAPEWLEVEAKLGGRSVLKGTYAEQREQFAGLGAALGSLAPPLPDAVETEDILINNGTLRVRVYKPKEAAKEGLSLGVYFHCGGYVMGSIEGDDYLCRAISMSASTVLVSVDYRLAPEHPYPAALEDGLSALTWAYDNAPTLHASPSKLYTMGQSAGGTIALALALKIKASGQPQKISGVVALGPATVAPSVVPAHLKHLFKPEENTDSAIIDAEAMSVYTANYNPPLTAPDFSILLSPDLAKLPPVYIVGCGKDPVRDDVLVFEQEIRKLGVKTKFDYYEGWPHLFWIVPGVEMGTKAVGNIVKGIQWLGENMG